MKLNFNLNPTIQPSSIHPRARTFKVQKVGEGGETVIEDRVARVYFGLAVTHFDTPWGDRFTVTQVRSGLRISPEFKYQWQARLFLFRARHLAPWRFPRSKFGKVAQLRELERQLDSIAEQCKKAK